MALSGLRFVVFDSIDCSIVLEIMGALDHIFVFVIVMKFLLVVKLVKSWLSDMIVNTFEEMNNL